MRIAPVVALLLVLCGVGALAESKRPAPSTSENHRENVQKAEVKNYTSSHIPTATYCLCSSGKLKPASQPNTKCENNKTSYEGWLTALFTGILAFIAGFQLRMFRRQLVIMEGGLSEAITTSKAAKESADAAQKSAAALIASERPFLTVSIVCKFDDADIEKMEQTVHCACKILNEGKSPAIINSADFKIMEAGEIDYSLKPGGRFAARIVLGVHDGEIIEDQRTFPVKTLNGKLVCYGVIEYSGIEGISTAESSWIAEFHHVYINPPGNFHRSSNTERNRYT